MLATLIRPYLAKSFRLPKDSSELNSEDVCCEVTPCKGHYSLPSQNLTLVKYTNYYYYSVVCLTTGPKSLSRRFLHIVRSKAFSFKWEYPLLSLRSSSSFLRLLPRLLVTSISPFIFPSITCFRRHFLRKMWPIQLAFRFRISRRIFLCSLTRSNTSSFLTWSIQLNCESYSRNDVWQSASLKALSRSLPDGCEQDQDNVRHDSSSLL